MRNGVVILSGKKGSGRNRIANFSRSRVVGLKKEKLCNRVAANESQYLYI
jgi:hypothetical protein